jgi:hypothetical protein
MDAYLVSIVIVTDLEEITRQTEILAEEPADAWPQGLEIATDSAAFQDGAIKSLSVTKIS